MNIYARLGVIYLAPGMSLDREVKSKYRLSVVATDRAVANARSRTAVVNVVVDDVNDSRPKFDKASEKITVKSFYYVC